MDLIKENKQKKRAVYKTDVGYRKVWYVKDIVWLKKHIELLNEYVPNYVLDYGYNEKTMWLDLNCIPGVPASTFEHTKEFVEKIYKFCLQNIEQTQPYAHGDWVLSNIIIDGDNIKMCDWDNLNLWPKSDIKKKLHSDLKSAFGDKFDPSSI